jgi:hypothetical protein
MDELLPCVNTLSIVTPGTHEFQWGATRMHDDIISINMRAIPTRTYASKPDPQVEDIIKNYQGKEGGRVDQHREQHHYPRPGKKHKRQ